MQPLSAKPSTINVLSVSSSPVDHQLLGCMFRRCGWTYIPARSLEEARHCLDRQPISVVVTDLHLPDGEWADLLEDLQCQPSSPHLIVSAANPDERTWAEVLNRGGYDVLVKPFHATEVFRVLSLALRHWADRMVRPRPRVLQATA